VLLLLMAAAVVKGRDRTLSGEGGSMGALLLLLLPLSFS